MGISITGIVAIIAIIVVVVCVAVVAMKIVVIWFLRQAVVYIPTYAQVTVGQPGVTNPQTQPNTSDRAGSPSPSHPNTDAGSVRQPILSKFPDVVTNPNLEPDTIQKFIEEMAKEKPLRFSSQHLKEFTRNFSTELGSGGFGVVYKGSFPSGVRIAVKVLHNSLEKRSLEGQFMAEVAAMGRTYHINLVRLYGFWFDSAIQALVYEYMENGSLDKLLFNRENAAEWGKLLEVAIGTAKGIAYLHEECDKRIIHYDIKPGNVLLDSNFNPKVADFGLARLSNRDSTHMELSGIKGTPGYAAPEVWTPFPVTYKCDVYSFGMLLFEIIGRRKNFLSRSSREWLPKWVYEKVERKEVAEMLSGLGIEDEVDGIREKAERAAMVALWCVQYSPAARPNMSDVVRMLEGGVEISPPPNPFAHLLDESSTSHSII